jgi:hypothetical protein
MKQSALRRLLQMLVMTALLFNAAAASAGEGFGVLRKRANLARMHPPQVRIGGSRISVRVNSQNKKDDSAAARLQSLLESELLGSDTTLRIDPKPDVTIDVSVLQSEYSEKWENRTGMRSVQTGTDAKGKPVYQLRETTLRFKVVSRIFSVSFKVNDAKRGKTLAADTIKRTYKNDFEDGNGAPDATALEDADVTGVVNDLTRRLTPTREVIGVLIPRGSLDHVVAFAEAGMWSKYLEAVEKVAAKKNPVDESYRQYAMGIAYEAMGYGADDLDTALKYLEQASTLYNAAAEANPRETYFILDSKSQPSFFNRAKSVATHVIPGVSKSAPEAVESSALLAPLARVQTALVQYQKMKELAEGGGAGVPGSPTAIAGAKSLDPGLPADPDTLTNDGVIEMLRAGLPESVILTSINTASKTNFDASPKGLIALAEANASTKVIERIQSAAKPKTSSKPAQKSSKKDDR